MRDSTAFHSFLDMKLHCKTRLKPLERDLQLQCTIVKIKYKWYWATLLHDYVTKYNHTITTGGMIRREWRTISEAAKNYQVPCPHHCKVFGLSAPCHHWYQEMKVVNIIKIGMINTAVQALGEIQFLVIHLYKIVTCTEMVVDNLLRYRNVLYSTDVQSTRGQQWIIVNGTYLLVENLKIVKKETRIWCSHFTAQIKYEINTIRSTRECACIFRLECNPMVCNVYSRGVLSQKIPLL